MGNFNRRKICENCGTVFAKENDNDKYCSICVVKANIDDYEKPNKTCVNCGKEYYTWYERKYCRLCWKNNGEVRYENVGRKAKDYNEINHRNPKPKGPKRKISFDELNRREEKRRLFDEKGLSRYYKGQKWDKI